MPSVRAFIAFEVPTTVQNHLGALSRDLQESCKSRSIRWVDSHNIHLTLKFLGDIPTSNLNQLQAIIAQETAKYSQFEVHVSGLGGFPSLKRPNVIWIAVNAPSYLAWLQKSIDSEMEKIGYPAEIKAFSPHLTLARISREATSEEIHQIGSILTAMKSSPTVSFRVEKISLFRSTLQPSGAVYNPLYTFTLK